MNSNNNIQRWLYKIAVLFISCTNVINGVLLPTNNIFNVNGTADICDCDYHVDQGRSRIRCEIDRLRSDCRLNYTNVNEVSFTNWLRSTNKLNAPLTNFQLDSSSTTSLMFDNVPFDESVKLWLLSQHFDVLSIFSYTNSAVLDDVKDCQTMLLNDEFLLNFSTRAPHLKYVTINTGLCQYSKNVSISSFVHYRSLTMLNISHNALFKIPDLPMGLKFLRISHNQIEEVSLNLSSAYMLHTIDLSNNKIKSIRVMNAQNLESLDASYNDLESIDVPGLEGSKNLKYLDISYNKLKSIDSNLPRVLQSLNSLIVTYNPIDTFIDRLANNPNLHEIDLTGNKLDIIDFDVFDNLSNLNILKLGQSSLRFITGNLQKSLPSLQFLDISQSEFKQLPQELLVGNSKRRRLDISYNKWTCDCNLAWLQQSNMDHINLVNVNETSCFDRNGQNSSLSVPIMDHFNKSNNTTTCLFGSYAENGAILRALHGKSSQIDCEVYGLPFPVTTWYRYENKKLFLIGSSNDSTKNRLLNAAKYRVNVDGTLSILDITRADIGIYSCKAVNPLGNQTLYFSFRLNYASAWFLVKVYSIICGILTAMGFFAFNMIWGAVRRFVTWRLSQVRRKGRVRLLLEAVEKYRTKQMDNLHDIYMSNINQIRENYHQQVEILCKSYTTQAERFRGYRTVQIEQVASHLDTLRDNYYAQLSRVRDYGSRRMESVWDSYQRQASRLRDYSFQQRMRLVRQYKLKQRYLNQVLENLKHTPQDMDAKTSRPVAPTFIDLQPIESHFNIDDLPTTSTSHNKNTGYIDVRRRPMFPKQLVYVGLRRSSSDPLLAGLPLLATLDRPVYASQQRLNVEMSDALWKDNGGETSGSESYHSVTTVDFIFSDKMATADGTGTNVVADIPVSRTRS